GRPLVDAGTEGGRAQGRGTRGVSWTAHDQPGRQDRGDGVLARGGQSRHQRCRQPEADRQAHVQPAVRRGRRTVAPQRATTVGPRPALSELRGDRGTLQRGTQLRGAGRQPQSGTAAPDVAVSAAGSAQGRRVQEFLREGWPLRPAQYQPGGSSSRRREPGDLIYLTYFNAGLRVYDIKDPLLP